MRFHLPVIASVMGAALLLLSLGTAIAAAAPGSAGLLESHPLRIDCFGRWSYAAALAPYYLLLLGLMGHFRVVFRFATWKFFFLSTALLLIVLGLLFELVADILYVWSFPEGRNLFMIRVPIFGWFTGHKIPVCEFLWIVGVVPLFYFLYLWATLVFYDIIYVVDEQGETYKKEERWVGFHGPTHIYTRKKGMKGREHEREVFRREPGFLARATRRMRHAGQT